MMVDPPGEEACPGTCVLVPTASRGIKEGRLGGTGDGGARGSWCLSLAEPSLELPASASQESLLIGASTIMAPSGAQKGLRRAFIICLTRPYKALQGIMRPLRPLKASQGLVRPLRTL